MDFLNSVIGGILGLANTFGDGVFDAVGGLFGWLVGNLVNFVTFLSAALPSNPLDLQQFMTNINAWNTGIGWLNWFLPIGQIAVLLGGWVVATVAYYAGRLILRFIGKLNIKDTIGI